MTDLPSYSQAVTRDDWLQLAAPYVQTTDYVSLCLVSQRFWRIFAPRLWVNILRHVRLSGLDPSDGKIAFLPFSEDWRSEQGVRANPEA